ncbi:helix-turn-helix domain-containing protein [Paenibacillus alvei]|uniref:helix-turn-helix domain-containing protein n=1 Tax=Paenibacillus alvei TaxID=44250 RepID=UPI0018CFAB0C|nr:helix-turn-helix domain-containing protein [Paenibacillus alvei]MCY9578723.1 helix-turn-helix domain-containing protein [Paenibacillus alvei]MCY9583781.1 helix-turn-helix domain-containing protein [Paenibacillus alvei]
MKKICSVSEVAEYLNVSTDSIYTMVREKQIPHVRIRRRIIFSIEVIEEWLREQSKTNEGH